MSYSDGFVDALILVKSKLDTKKHKDVLEIIEYYLNLAFEKKMEKIKSELGALR